MTAAEVTEMLYRTERALDALTAQLRHERLAA